MRLSDVLKDVVLGGVGVGSTMYSFMVAATPIIQFVSAVLGVIATCLAIYIYVRKINSKDNSKET